MVYFSYYIMHVEFKWTEGQYESLAKSCLDNPMLPFIKKYLPKDKPILEAGCGLGQIVKHLSENDYDVYGVEVSGQAVGIINRLDPNLKVIHGNIEQLDYPDNYFGGLMCFGVIEHIIEGPEKALRELYRVSDYGSVSLISVPVFNKIRLIKHYTGLALFEYFLKKKYHKLAKKDTGWLYEGVPVKNLKYHHFPAAEVFFEYRFTKKQMANFIREAGFEIVEEVPLEGLGGLYHELSGKLVNLNNPSILIRFLDSFLSRFPFSHHHTYLAIVKKS